jgi:hypothetical protein
MLNKLLVAVIALLPVAAEANGVAAVNVTTYFQYNTQRLTGSMTNGSPNFTVSASQNATPAVGPVSDLNFPNTTFFNGTTPATIVTPCSVGSGTCVANNNWTGSTGTSALKTYSNGGDTYWSTQCGGGTIFGTAADTLAYNGWYLAGSHFGSQYSSAMLTSSWSNVTPGPVSSGGMQWTVINPMNQTTAGTFGYGWGSEAQPGSDSANYKPGGILCITSGGQDYLFMTAIRNLAAEPQYQANTQLMVSLDDGLTYNPSPPSAANPFNQSGTPTWPGSFGSANFQAAGFAQCGAGYAGTCGDGTNTYVYAYGLQTPSQVLKNTAMLLGRATIANLIAHSSGIAQASDWTYYCGSGNIHPNQPIYGADGNSASSWCSNANQATPIIAYARGVTDAQPVYFSSCGGVWIMPMEETDRVQDYMYWSFHPWGPWKIANILPTNGPIPGYFPQVMAGSVSGTNAVILDVGSVNPGNYTTFEKSITLTCA